MFNLGFSELFVLAVIALLVIGPKQLPEVARTLGRLLNELKRATGDMTKSFMDAKNEMDHMSSKAKSDLEEKLTIQDLQRMIEKKAGLEAVKNDLNNIAKGDVSSKPVEAISELKDNSPEKKNTEDE
ncbi:MAG: twin-arginine translocase TatA/TatE family subunit [Bdellovibrionales bacterium]|nr:twin-arginine translocase TatA/TatE family subunit [Bdellovibrionales bacterium]MCB0414644.1 twin-arginine translocase TatA/TatE family subunit [Bdellovibrionales bacterium]